MSDDLKSKVVTVVDNGLFVDIALKLGQSFKKVYYWSPWISAFPKSNSMLPGDGFDEIERVKRVFDAIEKSDLVVYPDVYYSDMQVAVEKQGKLVWGARRGEKLELDRWGAKEMFKELGLPVSRAVKVQGVSQLREYLKGNPNVWVKISCNRGDAETFHAESYDLIEPRIDEMEYKLGGKKEICEFVVEDHLDAEIEVGYDGYCIDGNFPKRSFLGFEIKDLGFIGGVKEYKELPDFMRESNDALSPFFQKMRYRGFYSSELRVTKDLTAYPIDPCCRAASPPHEIYLEIFDNWADIMWEGAQGNVVDPNPVARYGVCAMLHSSWATKNWTPIHIPDDIRHLVKIRNHTRIDGVDYFVPQPDSDLPEIGALVAIGNTLEGAVEELKENAERIKAYSLEVKTDAIDAALEQVEKGKSLGLEI